MERNGELHLVSSHHILYSLWNFRFARLFWSVEDLRRRWGRQVLKWVWKRPDCWRMEGNFIWSLTGWLVDCWLVWCVRTSFIHSYMGNVKMLTSCFSFSLSRTQAKSQVKSSGISCSNSLFLLCMMMPIFFGQTIRAQNWERETGQWNNIPTKKASYSSLVTFLLSKFK